jgi:SAM-dependent methyltransferase
MVRPPRGEGGGRSGAVRAHRDRFGRVSGPRVHLGHPDDWVLHDLNAEPRLPFPDAAFDAATCCVSVDYLVRPLEVFDEVGRVLRPGAPFVCTFSNEYGSGRKGHKAQGVIGAYL